MRERLPRAPRRPSSLFFVHPSPLLCVGDDAAGDAATIKFTLDHVLSVSILVALVVVASAALQRASAERRESASSSRAPRAPKPEAKAD